MRANTIELVRNEARRRAIEDKCVRVIVAGPKDTFRILTLDDFEEDIRDDERPICYCL